MPVSQRTPCSESRAFRWQLPSRTPKPCKVHSCRTLIPFPHNTGNNIARSGFCTEGWLSAVSVLGTSAIRGNLKNRRNAPPISVRCTLLIRQRTPCSESRVFEWRLLNRTPKPYKYRSCRIPIPFPHNTRNNATYSSFCTGGRLSAVSVLGTTAIRQNLNMLAGNLPTAESTLHMYDKSGSIRPDR